MKKGFLFFTVLFVFCLPLNAQVFYEGQGGRNLGGIRVSEITGTGLSDDEAELLPLIQMTLGNDFAKYAGMTVPAIEDKSFSTRYTLIGTIRKTSGNYYLTFTVNDDTGITKTSYGPMQCTLDELRTLKGIKAASEELITGMGISLTQAGRNALRTTATNEAEAMNILAKSLAAGATEFERMLYAYQANQLDPTLAEAARRVAGYQAEIYQAPEINLAMPDIRIPEIVAPEFQVPEIRMAATGNIGADARQRQNEYNAQREASRIRQESGNKAMQEMQDAFLVQFIEQSEAVKKQQSDLLNQRDILIEQQRILLARQQQVIMQLRETENSYDTFFMQNPPFEIIYDPVVKQVGSDNLEKGTIDLQFRITSVGNQAMQVIPLMIADFEKGLDTIKQGLSSINSELDKIQSLLAQVETNGKNALEKLVSDYAEQMKRVHSSEDDYAAQLAKLDASLNTTGYAQLGRDYAVRPDTGYAERLAVQYAVKPTGYNAARDKTLGSSWSLAKWNKDETRSFVIDARLENDRERTIGRASVTLTNRILAESYTQPLSDSAYCIFRDVLVRDITDTLKVVIFRVNNRDVTVAANASYIKISPLEANGYTRDGWDIEGYDKDGYTVYGWNISGYHKDGYNKEGWDRNGFDRDGYDKDGFDKRGRNRMGQSRTSIERAEKREENKNARQTARDTYWNYPYMGINFGIGSPINIQPLNMFFDLGVEFGGRWFIFEGILGGIFGSYKLNDEIIVNKLANIDWAGGYLFNPRIGGMVPIYKGRVRFNIGGGAEWLMIRVGEKVGDERKSKIADYFVFPYAGARLDIPLAKDSGFFCYFSYRFGLTPENKMELYFNKTYSMRHTIFVGFMFRGINP